MGIERWLVDTSAIAIGFFSFAKFLMYSDLDVNNWPHDLLTKHPVIAVSTIKRISRTPKTLH